MEKFKFRQNFKGIIGLFQELQIGHVISIKDEKGNIIKFADFLAECCAYIINENLFDKAKELLKYQQLMYDVYAYCQSDKASTQAKEMDKECDFIGCFYILDDLKDWLRTESVDKQKDVSSKEFPEELNTDRAREYFKRAKNKQSITVRPELHIVNTKKKKGRPSKPFNDILVKDKEATKRKLHDLIDGKEDSKAVIYIKAAIQLGMMLKPTHTQFINEFGNIVSKQIFNKYLSANLYSDDEFAGAKQALINN